MKIKRKSCFIFFYFFLFVRCEIHAEAKAEFTNQKPDRCFTFLLFLLKYLHEGDNGSDGFVAFWPDPFSIPAQEYFSKKEELIREMMDEAKPK